MSKDEKFYFDPVTEEWSPKLTPTDLALKVTEMRARKRDEAVDKIASLEAEVAWLRTVIESAPRPPGTRSVHMIKAHCFTCLDDFKRHQWPSQFSAVPSVGHHVQSESGARLRICSITWTFGGDLSVELNR